MDISLCNISTIPCTISQLLLCLIDTSSYTNTNHNLVFASWTVLSEFANADFLKVAQEFGNKWSTDVEKTVTATLSHQTLDIHC